MRLLRDVYEVYGTAGHEFGTHIADWVAMSEVRYLESDRFVIFPSSKELLDSIMRARLNVQDFDAITPPAESFVVMMPAGYKTPEGVPLRTFLVQWIRASRNTAAYIDVLDRAKINTFKPEFVDDGMMLDVIMLDAETLALRSSNTASDVTKQIDAHDSHNAHLETPKELSFVDTNELEQKQMKAMIKLAVGLAVFDSAYENFLVSGLPAGSKLKKAGAVNLDNAVVMSHAATTSKGQHSKAGHIRAFHFRQLRDKRYYQGEHEGKPLGSRYVPVSESWIGEGIDSHTTNERAIK